ncbi:MAG: hypothetical protein ACK500_12875 [Flavobacteriales bacterium]
MKNLLFCFFSLCLSSGLQGQSAVVDTERLRVNDLEYRTSKEKIIGDFGMPMEIVEPNYECGFLSKDEQGVPYYSMKYDNLVFTGNDCEGYLMEEVFFDSALNVRITYNGRALSGATAVREFEEIFSTQADGEIVSLFFKGADDALVFTFKKGRLSNMRYWSPC